MSEAVFYEVGGWGLQLPTYRRRWVTFAIVTSVGVCAGMALRGGSMDLNIVGITFFLAAVSGVSGLWSP